MIRVTAGGGEVQRGLGSDVRWSVCECVSGCMKGICEDSDNLSESRVKIRRRSPERSTPHGIWLRHCGVCVCVCVGLCAFGESPLQTTLKLWLCHLLLMQRRFNVTTWQKRTREGESAGWKTPPGQSLNNLKSEALIGSQLNAQNLWSQFDRLFCFFFFFHKAAADLRQKQMQLWFP